MPIKLSAKGPEEIAEHFRGMAADEKAKAEQYRKSSDRTKAEHRAEAFEDAAKVLDNTTIEA